MSINSCTLVPLSRRIATIPDEEHFAFFSTIEAAGADWEAAAPRDDVFLSRAYLRALEESPPAGIRLGYLVFYQRGEPVGVAVLQWATFDGRAHVHRLTVTPGLGRWLGGVSHELKRLLANYVRGEVLVCGNLLLTGEHNFHFKSTIQPERALMLLQQALKEVAERGGEQPAVVLIKDISAERVEERSAFLRMGYASFRVQPCMVLPLSYRTFEDYLASMTTKYRTRAKRAFKKAAFLERRPLGLLDIQRLQAHLYALYQSVAQHSRFRWVDICEGYWLSLRRHLGKRFHLIGWYRGGELVGYHTAIENGSSLEAHFLGYDDAVNAQSQLYLNMLYDLVRLGIELGSERISLGRTALEIKSSVGAVPQDLDLFLRLRHPVGRHLCASLLHFLVPADRWVARHPFKRWTGERLQLTSEKVL